MSTKTQHGLLADKEIARLKSLHGSLYEIKVVDEDGNEHFAYVKKPDLPIIQAAAVYVESDPIKAGLLIYESVKISASPVIDNDDELKLSVCKRTGEIFKIRESEIKKL